MDENPPSDLREGYVTPEGLEIPYPDSILKILDCTNIKELEILRKNSTYFKQKELETEGYQQLAAFMIRTMHETGGVGLSAVQVGIPKQMVVVEEQFKKKPIVVVNPKIITRYKEVQDSTEACLSVPGLRITIKRPFNIIVKGKTLDWKDYEEEWQYMEATIFCHECDHLQGKLLLDHLGSLQRKMYNEKVKKIKKKARRMAKNMIRERANV